MAKDDLEVGKRYTGWTDEDGDHFRRVVKIASGKVHYTDWRAEEVVKSMAADEFAGGVTGVVE